MITKTDFLVYTATTQDERLQLVIFDCMVFYKSLYETMTIEDERALPEAINEDIAGIYNFGEWLCENGDYVENISDIFQLADDAQHAAGRAVEKFREEHLISASDWQMTWEQYLLFNKICNELASVSLRSAVIDFDCKEQKNDLEDREL